MMECDAFGEARAEALALVCWFWECFECLCGEMGCGKVEFFAKVFRGFFCTSFAVDEDECLFAFF